MKNLCALSLISSTLVFCMNSAKAEWDFWGITKSIYDAGNAGDPSCGGNAECDDVTFKIYTYNSKTNSHLLKESKTFKTLTGPYSFTFSSQDKTTGNLDFLYSKGSTKTIHSYSLENDSWTNEGTPWDSTYSAGSGERQLITKKADGSVTVGQGDSVISIDEEGIEKNGKNLLKKKSNGEIHLGENSWITKEEGGRQKVYAKDAAGNPIPIDYTNGTKLLINGRDVEQSINNVGALSAALTGLPTVPTDTTLACGFGTGTHGGDFAFAGGCASKVNETLSVNYAASMTMPGQDYAGDFEDTFSARAGFVWKLGQKVKPTLISMKEKKEF